jgi:UDP-glucuronate decarboxylase
MHPSDGRVVSNFIVQALTDAPITLYGDGTQTRSFCYVDDLIRGLMALMDTGKDITGPLNIGNPEEYSIAVLAQTIVELANSRSQIVHKPLPSDDPLQRQPNIARAHALLAWSPEVGLRDGLTRTIGYFDRLLRDSGRLQR